MDTTTQPLHPSALRPGDIVTIKAHDPENDPENLWSEKATIVEVTEILNDEGAYVLHINPHPELGDALCVGGSAGNLYIAAVRREDTAEMAIEALEA